jgi:hypothetical protein
MAALPKQRLHPHKYQLQKGITLSLRRAHKRVPCHRTSVESLPE